MAQNVYTKLIIPIPMDTKFKTSDYISSWMLNSDKPRTTKLLPNI